MYQHPTEEPPSSKFRERIKKIIRAFRKGPKTAASLQRLVYQLDDFQTLVQQNQGRAPLRHTSGHQIESIKRLRDHARDVYTVLRDGWNCECEHGHPASLRLEVWQSAGETPQPKQTGFHFLFSLAYSPSGDVSLGQVRYAEIRPLNSPKESDRGSCDPAEASPKATNSAVKRGTGRVTFQVPSSEGDQSHQTTESQEPYVTDLCEFIRNMDATTDSKTTRLGYLIDSNGQRYGIFRAQEQSPAIQGNVLSEYLGQLNSESPLIQPEGVEHGSLPQTLRFYNSDRVKLALTLAWSVLQFENTQWLGEDWSSNSILLAHGPRNVVFPYVRHSFASCRRESVANGDEKLALTRFPSLRDRPTQWVKVESLYTLGIVLIELCCGKLIEDLAIPKEMGPDGKPGPVTPFLTAMRLTKEVGHIFGSKYQEAVENCLFLKFWSADSHPSMMDESFQMGMHEAILEPLAQVVDLYPPTAVAT